MNIIFDHELKVFEISNQSFSYAMALNDEGKLFHIHFGKNVGGTKNYGFVLSKNELLHPHDRGITRSEFHTGDEFDFTRPCTRVTFADGSEILRMRYVSHEIKDHILSILMKDTDHDFYIRLIYKTYGDLPLIERSVVYINDTKEALTLNSAKSASFEYPLGVSYRLTHYTGEWGAEYQRNEILLQDSRVEMSTNYLTDAAAHALAFYMLDEDGKSTEDNGEVYFGALLYSGDYQITAESRHTQNMRSTCVTGGISDFTSRITLQPGEEFQTPSFVGGFSDSGFSKVSRILYDWQFDYIHPRGEKIDKAHTPFPIIYNLWYPYLFDIDEKKPLILSRRSSISARSCLLSMTAGCRSE